MYQIKCQRCGRTEGNGIEILKLRTDGYEPRRDAVLSDELHAELRCEACGIVEKIDNSVLPALASDHFSSVWVNEESGKTCLEVDGKAVQFEGIDEQIAKNAYYTPDGVRGTSTVHHITIHAIDPPTFSKGLHRIELGNYLSGEFQLSDIRYRDGHRRTLEFYQTIGNDSPEPVDATTNLRTSLTG